MRDVKEIIARAIILMTISDRCAMEYSKVEGVNYSYQQREMQRNAILNWVNKHGYDEYMTKDEKNFLKLPSGKSEDFKEREFQYEAIEPLLWTLGLIGQMSSYDRYVTKDFHPILNISGQHQYESLANACHMKSKEDIYIYNEIAMLWYWRVNEKNNSKFIEENIYDIICETFGEQYKDILLKMDKKVVGETDFIVMGKRICKLTPIERQHLGKRAQWRFHAFEWIVGESAWDEIELNA